ncbi:hypothetical protein AB0F17_59705 [Nonomuraea sp. NPDC026600]
MSTEDSRARLAAEVAHLNRWQLAFAEAMASTTDDDSTDPEEEEGRG